MCFFSAQSHMHLSSFLRFPYTLLLTTNNTHLIGVWQAGCSFFFFFFCKWLHSPPSVSQGFQLSIQTHTRKWKAFKMSEKGGENERDRAREGYKRDGRKEIGVRREADDRGEVGVGGLNWWVSIETTDEIRMWINASIIQAARHKSASVTHGWPRQLCRLKWWWSINITHKFLILGLAIRVLSSKLMMWRRWNWCSKAYM